MWLLSAVVLQWSLAQILANDTLVLVHVVSRHCERTPDILELYPSSPLYNESLFAPYGFGQITNEGKRHCYEIGTALRERYKNFLSPSYHYSKVEGISSDFGRTKESLQLILAGLFPPTNDLIWLQGMNWSPIATSYTEKKTDMLVMPYGTDWFKEEIKKFEESEEGKIKTAHFRDLLELMREKTGIEKIGIRQTAYIGCGLDAIVDFGYELPDWCKSIYPKISREYYNQYLIHQFATEKLTRMGCGYLLKKIVAETDMKINGSSKKEIIIYSGHDTTVMTILKIFDSWDETVPPLGSFSTLEVHKIDGIYGFKLYLFNDTSYVPYPVDIPGYGEFIPLDDVKNLKRTYLQLDDLKRTTNSQTLTSNSVKHSVNIVISVIMLCSRYI